jgi:hypothetical protein
MVAEAPIFIDDEPNIEEGIYFYPGHKYPRFVNIPAYLIDATDRLGVKRATFIELRVRNILSRQVDVVDDVVRNQTDSMEDSLGHDLTVTLNDDSPIRTVHVQVKASRQEIVAYKEWIKKKYFPDEENSEELVRNWLTQNRIILLNGTDGKSESEIIESFYPQLERIQQKSLSGQILESSGQMRLFPRREFEATQVFPTLVLV